MGGCELDSVFYYRIHSPVILIEFDHQLPANTRHLYSGAHTEQYWSAHVEEYMQWYAEGWDNQ